MDTGPITAREVARRDKIRAQLGAPVPVPSRTSLLARLLARLTRSTG